MPIYILDYDVFIISYLYFLSQMPIGILKLKSPIIFSFLQSDRIFIYGNIFNRTSWSILCGYSDENANKNALSWHIQSPIGGSNSSIF
jgi:hypothetical protein